MNRKRLLLFSNGAEVVGGEQASEFASDIIRRFLGTQAGRILFVPFAGLNTSYDDYAARLRTRFGQMNYEGSSIHEASDPQAGVREAEAIVIGGGNTFHLLRGLYEAGVVEAIRARVEAGVPYIGWSAGANVACPTIRTTNDMPVVEPPSFDALNLVPFQINPHYTDARLENHHGETRDERLAEFVKVNPGVYVVGLREGSVLKVENSNIELLGDKPARIFINDQPPFEVSAQDSLQFLLD